MKAIADENGLGEVSKRKESMGLCFVGKRKHFDDFLKNVRLFFLCLDP